MLDYIRIACAVPQVQVANVEKNTQDICAYMEQADGQNADLLLFPELAMTGYTCGDLFLQDALLDAVEAGLVKILECSANHPQLTVVVGLPVRSGMKILNCAAVIDVLQSVTRGRLGRPIAVRFALAGAEPVRQQAPDKLEELIRRGSKLDGFKVI